MDSARTLGPLVGAGLLVSLGLGVAYGVVALMYLVSLALTLGVEHVQAEEEPGPRPSPVPVRARWPGCCPSVAGDAGADVAGLPGQPDRISRWSRTVGCCPMSPMTSTILMRPGSLSWRQAMAWGRSSRPSAWRPWAGRGGRSGWSLAALPLWYVLLAAYGFTETQAQGMAILFLIGVAQGLAMISMAVALLRFTDARFRGRVMGVRMLAVYGLADRPRHCRAAHRQLRLPGDHMDFRRIRPRPYGANRLHMAISAVRAIRGNRTLGPPVPCAGSAVALE